MKRVAICTLFYNNYNYGGILQCFALYKVLENMGCSTEVISYDDKACQNPIYPTNLSRCSQYSIREIIFKLKDIISAKVHSNVVNKQLEQRFALFKRFIETNINSTERITDKDLESLSSLYDVFISGSDQVWNPNAVRTLYLQNFTKDNTFRKVSYAASISRNKLSSHEKNILASAISRFDYISVREKTAKNILNDIISNDISVVLDPTMLLASDVWSQYASEPLTTHPYVLVYGFSKFQFDKYIINYYKSKGVDVIFIPFAKQVYNSFDNKSLMKPIWNVGPAEFLSLIKNAQMIFTDSFHGSVFSILFNKPFAVYDRDKNNNKTSKNSRLYDLLKTFKLNKCLIKNVNDIENLKNIDYKESMKVLVDLRAKSYNWLYNSIFK